MLPVPGHGSFSLETKLSSVSPFCHYSHMHSTAHARFCQSLKYIHPGISDAGTCPCHLGPGSSPCPDGLEGSLRCWLQAPGSVPPSWPSDLWFTAPVPGFHSNKQQEGRNIWSPSIFHKALRLTGTNQAAGPSTDQSTLTVLARSGNEQCELHRVATL